MEQRFLREQHSAHHVEQQFLSQKFRLHQFRKRLLRLALLAVQFLRLAICSASTAVLSLRRYSSNGKTRLGVSVAVFGSFIYAAALFGGYTASVILVGYVLLMESNDWLKKTAVKALATLACFSFILLLIGLIPDAFDAVSSLLRTFGLTVSFSFVTNLFGVLTRVVSLLKDLVFAGLIFKSLNQGTIKIPFVDGIVEKYM